MNKIIGILALVILMITSVAGGHDSNKTFNSHNISVPSNDGVKAKALTRLNFEDSVRSLYNKIGLSKVGMNFDAFRYGMIGYYALKNQGKVENSDVVSFIDFTKKSTEKRFYTVDLKEYKVSKSAIQFPNSKALPLDLISRMIEFRKRENVEAANKKNK